jgi:antitoxin component of RelBE/YafQ-DinJ toxin-antitoxin module
MSKSRKLSHEIRVRVSEADHAQVKAVCAEAGTNLSFVIRAFVAHVNKADGQPFPLTFASKEKSDASSS